MTTINKADQLFEHYGESHQNKINKTIHWIAVPAILFSFLGIIWSIPFPTQLLPTTIAPYFNWATIAIALTLYYYYQLSVNLALAMMLIFFGMSFFIVQIEQSGMVVWQVCTVVFIVAWIFQFIGHKIEGKKPSFLHDIQYLLIGPLWLMHFLFKKIGLTY